MILTTHQTAVADPVLDGIVEEITRAFQTGLPVELPAYQAMYPQYAEILVRLVPSIQSLTQLAGTSLSSADPAAGLMIGASGLQPGVLGDFRLIREVGRGGMGIVYEAEQVSLDRRVALKVLPFAAVLDERQLARFKNESRAAATLHHANIVPVFSVGCERGVHFYAMQFIDGQTLAQVIVALRAQDRMRERRPSNDATTDFRDSASPRDLPVEPRPHSPASDTLQAECLTTILSEQRSSLTAHFRTIARLGIQAGEALEHAHQHGVVHRDVKPANLMLDATGNLWIADFGLARLEADAGMTMTGDLVGTLRYMSPEQALGQRGAIDHRTDIYSLGVTLYELLTHAPPFDGDDRVALLRQIADDEPQRLRRLNPSIPADLETIVLKALEKSPIDRYATAQELADDLHRWLGDKPILARRPTLLHQTRKWSQRHRAIVKTAAGVALLALVVGGVVVYQEQRKTRDALADSQSKSRDLSTSNANLRQQTQRAETNLELARHIIAKAFTQKADELDRIPHLKATQRRLLQQTIDFYEGLPKQETGDPEVRWETAQAYHQLGETYRQLNKYSLAVKVYQRAIGLRSELAREFPDRVKYQRELASSRGSYGNALDGIGDHQNAQQSFIEAIRAFREVVAQSPGDFNAKHELAYWLAELAGCNGAQEGGIPLLREALALRENLVLEHGEVPYLRWGLASVWLRLGDKLSNSGKHDEAMAAARKVIDIGTPLVRRFPNDPVFRDVLGEGHLTLAALLQIRGNMTESDRSEAILSTRESMRIFRQLGAETPDYHRYRLQEARGSSLLANLLPTEEMESEYRSSIDYWKSLDAQFPEVTEYRDGLGLAYSSFIDKLLALDRPEDAEPWAREALRRNESLAKQSPRDPEYRYAVIQSKRNVFCVLDRLKRWRDSQRDVSEWMRDAEQLLADNPGHYRHRVADEFRKCYSLLTDSPDPQVRDPLCATQLAARAVELAPDDGFRLVRKLYHQGKSQMVVAILRDCNSFDLHVKAEALAWLARAHCQLDQLDQAIDTVHRAIAAYDESESWMRDHPQDVDVGMHASNRVAVELLPDIASAVVIAGKQREAHLIMEMAIARCRRALERDTPSYRGYNKLAWILATTEFPDLRNPVESLEWVRKSRSIKPDSISALQAEVAAYYRLGRWSDASKSAEHAMKVSQQRLLEKPRERDEVLEAIHQMSFLYAMNKWQLGDHVRAREIYTEATKDANHEESWSDQLIREEAEALLGITPPAAASNAPRAPEP